MLFPSFYARYLMLFAVICAFAVIGLALPVRTQAAPTSVTVGDPANPAALAKAVQDAYTHGARTIIIHPGVYYLPSASGPTFSLNGWSDATLSGYHVTLIITDLHDECFDLNNCTNVTLEGALISQNAVTFYQGKIISVGQDANGKFQCVWKGDAGYPLPNAGQDPKTFFSTMNVVDAHTRHLKIGIGDTGASSIGAEADGTYLMHFNSPKMNIAVGDWLVGRHGDAPFKVHVVNCHNCTIKDITMMRNGFAPLREENGGANHYIHDIWDLGPAPKGATEQPIVTNAADGMHMTGAYPGPDIEDCVMTGVFLDDCIAIHGSFTDVTAVSGNVVTCKQNQWNVGDIIQLADTQGDFQEAKVTAISQIAGGQWNITLDQPVAIHYIENNNTASVSGDKIESKATNPMRNGAGYKIINCKIGDTRSRGILAKADNGLIKGNQIIGCGMSAVSLGPEFYWNEAGYVRNVLVEHNLIENNGGATYGGSACWIHGDGAIGNQNITIRNNRFVSNYQGDFVIQWANGVTIANNTIIAADPLPAFISPQNMMSIADAENITLKGNVVKNAGLYKIPLAAVGENVSNVTNNDSAGIKALPFRNDGAQ